MCVCCCTNECSKWLLDCILSSSPSTSPSSAYSEELLFGNQTFGKDETDQSGNGEHPDDKLERLRRKREHRLRTTSLLKANQMVESNSDMIDQISSHHKKQLFNVHGYNLAIYKGHVRGYYIFDSICKELI